MEGVARRYLLVLFLAALGYAQRLEIVSARYGAGGSIIDVTERVRGLSNGETLEIRVDIPTMGQDPAPGLGKRLLVSYKWDGNPMEASAGDFEELRLPRLSAGLGIVSARWVAGDKALDVRDLLQSLIREDKLSVKADNQPLGGDPAVGKTKYLEVRYEFRGNVFNARVKEGQNLNVPSQEALSARSALPVFSGTAAAAPPSSAMAAAGVGAGDSPTAPSVTGGIVPSAIGGAGQPGLRIFYARYGVEGREADVRDRLRPLLVNDQLSVKADNTTMGGDPAQGAQKRLQVIYEVYGRTHARTVAEGQTLTLP